MNMNSVIKQEKRINFENLKSNPRAYKNMLKRTANKKYTYEWTALENFGGECTVDDIIKKATKSQKIALNFRNVLRHEYEV